MSCDDCNKDVVKKGDRYGNPIQERSSMETMESNIYDGSPRKGIDDISYTEYNKEKKVLREKAKLIGNMAVKEFSDDYKRIQLDELVHIANYEEVGAAARLSPDQAVAALWNLVHHEAYTKVANEFDNLIEQIDKRYEELKKKRIILKWDP